MVVSWCWSAMSTFCTQRPGFSLDNCIARLAWSPQMQACRMACAIRLVGAMPNIQRLFCEGMQCATHALEHFNPEGARKIFCLWRSNCTLPLRAQLFRASGSARNGAGSYRRRYRQLRCRRLSNPNDRLARQPPPSVPAGCTPFLIARSTRMCAARASCGQGRRCDRGCT